ncbi:MAG: hypothetical protein IPH45_09010 [Bacteroidales bacterium]|nr:hypothetical protein [Bacteroidales bacterium]
MTMENSYDRISDAFKDRSLITSQELAVYYRTVDHKLTDEGIRKRISRLKRTGTLVSIGHGVYTMADKPIFKPENDAVILKLAKLFSTVYPELNSCVWSSAWLNDFMIHQPTHYFYLFETEPDVVESTFNLLKENNINAWLNPDEKTMQLYVMDGKNSVVVKPLISRSPIIKSKVANLPMLEKMLVDTWADKKLFYFLQGAELSTIFNFAFSKYTINYSRLLSYARRRGIEQKSNRYVKFNIKISINPCLND